jgi:hypothetical protein
LDNPLPPHSPPTWHIPLQVALVELGSWTEFLVEHRRDIDQMLAPTLFSEFYNDLLEFDTATLRWTSLSGALHPPAPRFSMGFAAADGQLFVFGGQDREISSQLGARPGLSDLSMSEVWGVW